MECPRKVMRPERVGVSLRDLIGLIVVPGGRDQDGKEEQKSGHPGGRHDRPAARAVGGDYGCLWTAAGHLRDLSPPKSWPVMPRPDGV